MPESNHTAGSFVASVQICPGHRKPMHRVPQAEAVENLGLKGDRHASAGSSRQVLLIEKETLDLLALGPGQVKENITTVGIELMKLQPKDRLRIGDEVVLEITSACSPCGRMEEIKPGLLQSLAGRRGMLARVVKSGTVSSGDPVSLVRRA